MGTQEVRLQPQCKPTCPVGIKMWLRLSEAWRNWGLWRRGCLFNQNCVWLEVLLSGTAMQTAYVSLALARHHRGWSSLVKYMHSNSSKDYGLAGRVGDITVKTLWTTKIGIPTNDNYTIWNQIVSWRELCLINCNYCWGEILSQSWPSCPVHEWNTEQNIELSCQSNYVTTIRINTLQVAQYHPLNNA